MSTAGDEPVVGQEGAWEALEGEPLCGDQMGQVYGGDEVDEDETSAQQIPLCMPCPMTPTANEIATHNLSRMPYRTWCPWCVAGRRPNSQHRSMANAPRFL